MKDKQSNNREPDGMRLLPPPPAPPSPWLSSAGGRGMALCSPWGSCHTSWCLCPPTPYPIQRQKRVVAGLVFVFSSAAGPVRYMCVLMSRASGTAAQHGVRFFTDLLQVLSAVHLDIIQLEPILQTI